MLVFCFYLQGLFLTILSENARVYIEISAHVNDPLVVEFNPELPTTAQV